nr:terpene synthase 10-like [Ipomoea batatas]
MKLELKQMLLPKRLQAERFVTRRDEFKERVKDMLKNEEMKELEKMEMIDELQRLGCSYHFEDEIKAALMDIYMKNSNTYKSSSEEKDLYATALQFRLLRQNGYNISQDVFDVFMDGERSSFKANLCEDTKGLLNLYEASFLSMEGETTLKLAKDFSTKHMKYVAHDQNLGDQNLLASVQHALELPLHWRMPRLEAKCFIDSYKVKTTWNPILLEFAKLDFNLVQAVHQEDLKFVSRWDDVSETGHLPEYMKFCYVALHNFVNEVASDVLKEHNIFIVPYLRKAWGDLCKAYLQEAKWYHSGYTPTFEEYIETAWISISCPLTLVHAFFYFNNPVEDAAALHCLTQYHQIIRLSSIILRLANDKATSPNEMKRGDVPKAIQCYMNEGRVSSNTEARDFINFQISETWKKMNKFRIEGSPFSEKFIEVAMNIARMAQCMYQHGDGHGIKNLETQTRIQTLLFEPIPLI